MNIKKIKQMARLERAAAEHMRQTAFAYATIAQQEAELARRVRADALASAGRTNLSRPERLADAWLLPSAPLPAPQSGPTTDGEASSSI